MPVTCSVTGRLTAKLKKNLYRPHKAYIFLSTFSLLYIGFLCYDGIGGIDYESEYRELALNRKGFRRLSDHKLQFMLGSGSRDFVSLILGHNEPSAGGREDLAPASFELIVCHSR